MSLPVISHAFVLLNPTKLIFAEIVMYKYDLDEFIDENF